MDVLSVKSLLSIYTFVELCDVSCPMVRKPTIETLCPPLTNGKKRPGRTTTTPRHSKDVNRVHPQPFGASPRNDASSVAEAGRAWDENRPEAEWKQREPYCFTWSPYSGPEPQLSGKYQKHLIRYVWYAFLVDQHLCCCIHLRTWLLGFAQRCTRPCVDRRRSHGLS